MFIKHYNDLVKSGGGMIKTSEVMKKRVNISNIVIRMLLPFYGVSLVVAIYSIIYQIMWTFPAIKKGGGTSKLLYSVDVNKYFFLTGWNYILQIVFLLVAISHELSEIMNLDLNVRKRLGKARAIVFDTFTFPCSLLVSTVFWSLWAIDRELIFPRELSTVFPNWLNHVMHTFILIPVLVEILAPNKCSFVDYKRAAISLFVFGLIYQIVYVGVYALQGVWLYPVHDKLNWPQRMVFFAMQFVFVMSYQKLGITLRHRKKMHTKVK